jgi:two-component system chemotaxis sensor kinase CheA
MSIVDDEILESYIEESREHLADIENDLLAIEETGADIDEDLVNKVFRAAHSIKGGAGFMGLKNIQNLAHKIENVLGLIRSREMIPTPEIVNILLLAFDRLRDLINNVDTSNEEDISEHVTALVGLTEGPSQPKEEKQAVSDMVDICLPDGRCVFIMPQADISQAEKGGKFIFLAELRLKYDVGSKDRSPSEIVDAVRECGVVLETDPDMTAEDHGKGAPGDELVLTILFASIIEPDLIDSLFETEDHTIHHITQDLIVKSSDSAALEAEPESEETETVTAPVDEKPRVEAPEKKPKPKPSVRVETKPVQVETSLRVHVSVLDSLMNLAGELVLGRNQLLRAVTQQDIRSIENAAQPLNLITSELQEAIMLTRMQPIGNVFNKFPRVVRDMARNLNKDMDLILEGKEVELDKTIIEGISDPLTHLIRNSVDHGIENPDDRRKAGKAPKGKIMLRAYHEAGQVNIEITDDGKGLDGDKLAAAAIAKGLISEDQARTMSDKEKVNLIFMPGFSTAKEVTDVSGRGVGMDVVKTNLDKLGGQAIIDSQPGKGTSIQIRLPLTLAIIPSQIVSTGGERYAIPQVNLEELLRIPADQVKDKIEKVGDAEVVRLRGNLLPLVRLADAIGVERTFIDPNDEEKKPDRRDNIADRRSQKSPLFSEDDQTSEQPATRNPQPATRNLEDRRYHTASALKIAVVSAGTTKYGLVVDELHDSEEIVVKPLGRHFKDCKGYAGATIMGDGRVALILDVAGIARMAELISVEGTDRAAQVAKESAAESEGDIQSLLMFRSADDEQFAVPLGLVSRIERIKKTDVELVGGKRVMQYRGTSLPLFAIDEVADVKPLADRDNLLSIVFQIAGREVGLLATAPTDAVEVPAKFDDTVLTQPGIKGSAIIDDHTTMLVDINGLIQSINPDWFSERDVVMSSDGKASTILFAEDSKFFRDQVKDFIEQEGYNIIEAEDGIIAWNLLQKHGKDISLVLTDIEMPNLDGLGLSKKIKGDERFSHLPIIALTTLAGEEDVARGKDAGIDDYQYKLDREKLLESVYEFLRGE